MITDITDLIKADCYIKLSIHQRINVKKEFSCTSKNKMFKKLYFQLLCVAGFLGELPYNF